MPTRRQILAASGATAATFVAPAAWARVDRVAHAVRTARARWARQVEELLSVELLGGTPTQTAAAREQARGLFAPQAHEAIAELSVEDQCHPEAQALLDEVTAAIGGALVTTRTQLEAWLDDPATADDAVVAALAVQARGLGQRASADLGGRAGRTTARALDRLEGDPEALRREVRRSVRRMRRVEARAARMAAAPDGMEHDVDADTRRRVAVGRARHGTPTGLVGGLLGLIGVVLLALVLIGGLMIAFLGLILNTALGLGILFLVVGLALVTLAIIGIVAIIGG